MLIIYIMAFIKNRNKMNLTTPILHSYFSPAALRLAWERMIRSNGKDVKDFFGIEICGLTVDSNKTVAHSVFCYNPIIQHP